jgi:hypothetical protein
MHQRGFEQSSCRLLSSKLALMLAFVIRTSVDHESGF